MRVKAVQALWTRDPEAAGPEMRSAREDPSEEVMRMAVAWMAGRAPSDPSVQERLRSVAREDPSAQVRRVAAEALRTGER